MVFLFVLLSVRFVNLHDHTKKYPSVFESLSTEEELAKRLTGDQFNYLGGALDEVRVETVRRYSGDILNMWNNMNSTATYYTIGAQEGKRNVVRLGAK